MFVTVDNGEDETEPQEILVNQLKEGGQWNLLGAFTIPASGRFVVTLKGPQAYADGIRFVHVQSGWPRRALGRGRSDPQAVGGKQRPRARDADRPRRSRHRMRVQS